MTCGPIAYLTGEYPRATDTFIQREVAGLRDQGIAVLTCSIRKTSAQHLVGDEQRTEAAQTFYVLAAAKHPIHLMACQIAAMAHSPKRFFSALGLALRTRAPGIKAFLYQLIYFLEAAVLAAHMRRNNVTHLHNHIATSSCSVAMLASRLSGIPYSFTLHGPDIFFEPHRWRLDAKIAEATFVACISHFCRSQAMAFSAPADWGKLHIVHCGVDPVRYETDQPARPGNTVLFVGRLAAVKGVPILFQALQRLQSTHPDLRATLIGDGPERAGLEMQARQMGLTDSVHFAGYQSQSDVAAALQNSDMLVLPSFAEGVPVVLMEAMAAQLPVVTTRIAGVPELVQDGISGILVSPGDVDGLTRAMSDLLNDKNRCIGMGQNGRAMVLSDFDVARESAWLATLLAAYANNGDKPGLRPEVPQ